MLPALDDDLERVAVALADHTRRQLLRLLHTQRRSAGELAREFPSISRPAVSQHLRVLREAGLVSVAQVGRQWMYDLNAPALAPLSRFVDEMWRSALPRLKQAAEEHDAAGRDTP